MADSTPASATVVEDLTAVIGSWRRRFVDGLDHESAAGDGGDGTVEQDGRLVGPFVQHDGELLVAGCGRRHTGLDVDNTDRGVAVHLDGLAPGARTVDQELDVDRRPELTARLSLPEESETRLMIDHDSNSQVVASGAERGPGRQCDEENRRADEQAGSDRPSTLRRHM